MKARALFALFACLLMPHLSLADDKGTASIEDGPPLRELSPIFLGWCKQYQDTQCPQMLVTYRAAMADLSQKRPELPSICEPDPIDAKGLTDHVIKRLEQEADLLRLAGGEAVAEIMMQDFECKKD